MTKCSPVKRPSTLTLSYVIPMVNRLENPGHCMHSHSITVLVWNVEAKQFNVLLSVPEAQIIIFRLIIFNKIINNYSDNPLSNKDYLLPTIPVLILL